MVRVAVAGWIGSDNLGDELVFAGLRTHLDALSVTSVALSIDPAATTAAHGTMAVDPGRLPIRLDIDADALILGGGGLIQDVTSPFNLPVHLSRVLAASRAHLPVAAIGLGCSQVRRRWSRALTRSALGRARPITVRNDHSARVLVSLGLDPPAVTADLALALNPVSATPVDALAVCLRPWAGPGGLLPASVRHRVRPPDPRRLEATAAVLDRIASTTGLAVRFVAFDRERDGKLSERIADLMRTEATVVRPSLVTVLDEIAACRAVVAMRYHAGIAALLTERPAVMIGYDPKVDALVAESAGGLRGVGIGDETAIPGALEQAMADAGRVGESRDALRHRERQNRMAIEELLSRIGA